MEEAWAQVSVKKLLTEKNEETKHSRLHRD